jgi:hypothetical protein
MQGGSGETPQAPAHFSGGGSRRSGHNGDGGRPGSYRCRPRKQRFSRAPPDDWPTEWPAGRYAFPEVYPRMPTRKDYPPDQVNLDKLATFVIE